MSSAPIKKTTLKIKKTKPVEETEVLVEALAPEILVKKVKKVKTLKETEVEEAIVTESSTESSAESSFEDAEESWTSSQLLEAINDQRKIVREAEMKVSKLFKKLGVAVRKESRKSKSSKSSKSGVKRKQKERPIVDTLAELMGVAPGTEYSRGDIQAYICKYIKDNKLQSEDDRKCFETDGRLERVLGKPQYAAHDKNQSHRHSYNNLMKVLGTLFVREEPEIVA